jgi:hypothetical protein
LGKSGRTAAVKSGTFAIASRVLFGTGVRYSGVWLGCQLVTPFAGELAPLIALHLVFSTMLPVFAIWLAPETYRCDLTNVVERVHQDSKSGAGGSSIT